MGWSEALMGMGAGLQGQNPADVFNALAAQKVKANDLQRQEALRQAIASGKANPEEIMNLMPEEARVKYYFDQQEAAQKRKAIEAAMGGGETPADMPITDIPAGDTPTDAPANMPMDAPAPATTNTAKPSNITALEARVKKLSEGSVLMPELKPMLDIAKSELDRAQKLIDKTTEPATEYQAKSALFANRMASSEPILNKFKDANTLTEKGLKGVPVFGNFLVSENFQQLDQAKRDFINATLRQESGAAIGPNEFKNAELQYFPQPGDTQDTITQKANNRAIAIKQMENAAGASYKRFMPEVVIPEPLKAAGITAEDIAEFEAMRKGK